MNVKEILELIEEGYSSEDREYKKRVYFISNFISALVFFLLHLVLSFFENITALTITMVLIIIMGVVLIIRQKRLYKKVHGYFDKILEEIIVYGLACIIISSISVFVIYPPLLGVFIASIYGLLLCVDGILFKSKYRKVCGLLLIFSTILMILYLNYQFLILGTIQMIIAFILLFCDNK
ncbi:conserved membrane protein of unknown function [Methanocaldococcus lauensis]|uniref:Uncharacterized protein n=1 Tax=Methanocaldococcus lauensis TaxID=2546128 RepID=A0A8D6SWR2_9EURY|nr:hypothetical protein [Methanocaldococcus lauensis]CAB3287970.1 conserved membrane protein of unknown function [Methanocaldococcus lauensis]CAB3288503.1 conserved membrane protein of unknown function [Methanocaldococcus lauensis]